MFSEVDIESWNRKTAYEYFKNYDDPFFNIAGNLDATRLYDFCKTNKLSFALAILFYSQQTANEIREFKFRLLEEKLVEFEAVHANHPILLDDETFSFCYFENRTDIFEFNAAGKKSIEKYKALRTFDVERHRVDLIYYSVIPWISFTSFKHAHRSNNQFTIPRIVFGKMFDNGGKRSLPISVEVHHAMMDGFHVGKYFNRLQEKIENPG